MKLNPTIETRRLLLTHLIDTQNLEAKTFRIAGSTDLDPFFGANDVAQEDWPLRVQRINGGNAVDAFHNIPNAAKKDFDDLANRGIFIFNVTPLHLEDEGGVVVIGGVIGAAVDKVLPHVEDYVGADNVRHWRSFEALGSDLGLCRY